VKILFAPTTASGPILDVTCDVEQLEDVNDSQLYSIFDAIRQTAFFRMFAVDLDERCPLTESKRKSVPEPKESKKEEPSSEPECAGELEDLDPDAGPSCGVQADTMPWQSTFSGSSQMSSTPDSSLFGAPPQEKKEEEEGTMQTEEESEEEFECTGGPLEDELDEDDEPLCALSEDSSFNTPSPMSDMMTSALRSIAEQFGWESESQRKTFSWSSHSDPIITKSQDTEPCESDESVGLPDTFWIDMCSNIKAGDGLKMVNLVLNPERNTGYNGTHIWKTIYEENCITNDGPKETAMCYEERVLYRLLSGLHASTTLSIAKHYYPPSKRKGRENWEPNPDYFMSKFGENPDYIRNVHFSYVVLLRALKKASSYLYNYEISTGNIVEDETATILLRRLLDSTILQSCRDVFSAFDESLMFREENERNFLQQNFKGVFHNISSILDCVQCQQCKLHGKMAMLGYGTALKILFMREDMIRSSLSRNEVVALINTLAKFSESLREIRELTHLYWVSQSSNTGPTAGTVPATLPNSEPGIQLSDKDTFEAMDTAVGAIATLAKAGKVTADRESELINMAINSDPRLLILARHYGSDVNRFLEHASSLGGQRISATGIQAASQDNAEPDAIVVGSGLAGSAAVLTILDRGGRVVLIEKEHSMGGNSNKASSGINACCPYNNTHGDSLDSFRYDTIKSAGSSAQHQLVDTLVSGSEGAVTWLKDRVGVDLTLLAQLGGHGHKRTHRPSNGMAGAEIMFRMHKAIKQYEKQGLVEILVDTRVTDLLTDQDGTVIGVKYQNTDPNSDESFELRAPRTILATGGFASDRSSGSYLEQHRPELLSMPATAGAFSTGDGVRLATAIGADTIDMDKVQVHPTGWVDPTDPDNLSKILAAELMRGVGGILINNEGERFCNELGTRAYVTDAMLSHNIEYKETRKWNADHVVPTFSLVLSSSAAEDGKKHVDLYSHKGLLKKLSGVQELADWMGQDVETVRSTLRSYQEDAKSGTDVWGKTSFRGIPDEDLENETFFAGTVTPVLHYCMGGITIDTEGNVLSHNRTTIAGLHAAGEVTGGVHGNNRLGGNSLLECTVFGTRVGKQIPIQSRTKASITTAASDTVQKQDELKTVSEEELQKHNTPEDCWVAIHGDVYDLTEFANEHPAGALSITNLAGIDGTEAFAAVHNQGLLEDFDDVKIGVLQQ